MSLFLIVAGNLAGKIWGRKFTRQSWRFSAKIWRFWSFGTWSHWRSTKRPEIQFWGTLHLEKFWHKMELVAIPCPICGTSYPSRISVKNHIKVRHPGRNLEVEMQRLIAKYPLLFSTSTSSSSSSPSPTSIRRGRARQYNCDKCSKTFFNFSGFRIHFKSQCVGVSEQSKSVKSVVKSSEYLIQVGF